MQRTLNTVTKIAALLFVVLLGACAESLGVYEVATTRDVAPLNATDALKPDQSLIVLIRPRRSPMEATVFDVTDGNLDFVASIPGGTKLAFHARPGKRRYMIVGLGNADFITTNLEPGKVSIL